MRYWSGFFGLRSVQKVFAIVGIISLLGCLELVSNTQDVYAEPTLPTIEDASWIWGNIQHDICEFRTEVYLEHSINTASVLITADNGYELYINGALVGYDIGPGSDVWGSIERWDIAPYLLKGSNAIGIRAISLGGSRGVIAALRLVTDDDAVIQRVTDASWRVSPNANPLEYALPDYEEAQVNWTQATVLGKMGMAPWGNLVYEGSVGGRRVGGMPAQLVVRNAPTGFDWPQAIAFVADDRSIYKTLDSVAWGIEFRVGDWTRAYTQFDLPTPSKIGSLLCVLNLSTPDMEPQVLIDVGQGVLGSPSVSFDGKYILLSMAPEGTSFFHIYRVPVSGAQPVQLTYGPFHDVDPAELPDGRIVFSSTRIGTFEEYHGAPSRALFVMEPDGSGIKPITHTPIFDNEPEVLADGRIAFVRSDNFFGRAKVETVIHAIQPDGTSGQTELGADVGATYGHRLRALGYGSPAPLPDGRIAVISNKGNFVADLGAREESFHRLPDGLGDLAPLPDGRLLATVLGSGSDRRSRILAILDPEDNSLTRVFESETPIHSPVFLGPRSRPMVRPETINTSLVGKPEATGFLYAQDVSFTRKTKADWDQIRAIRVLRSRALSTRSSHWDFVHQGKEVTELGTVPIAPDGSFYVEVPADVPLAFQAVDAEGRAELNEMSWLYVRPGEVRSCIGCHEDRRAAPPVKSAMAEALRSKPLKLLAQGEPHRWRGNNAGVSGMMDLQFERFRETASLNLYQDIGKDTDEPLLSGRQDVLDWIEKLHSPDEAMRISAANRLALFRDRAAAPALVAALDDPVREVRVAVVLALSSCGTRESIQPLITMLEDADPVVAQAAAIALENLTAHHISVHFPPDEAARKMQAQAWQRWLDTISWHDHEQELITRLTENDRAMQRQAVIALGHIGGDVARAALRQYVSDEKNKNPYPRFVNNNRTDSFTFDAESPMNPRTLQAATRALGHLGDTEAVSLLLDILREHQYPETGNLFLAEAAAEALGWIGTPEAEAVLIDIFSGLGNYVDYVGWYSDHPALYACHSSPLHARIIEALDRIGSTRTGPIVPHIIRSVPTDPDRALYLETDTYELLTGRVILRSGRGDELIETCLNILGDPDMETSDELRAALAYTFNAWAGQPDVQNRAAQLLSAICRDQRYEPAVRAAYERYRAMPEEIMDRALGVPEFHVSMPQRHWVLFFLGRTLGNLGNPASVDTLLASLSAELNEARHGRPDPAATNVHLLQLEATPCWRGAAAWALGRIGDPRAVAKLLAVVLNMDNAVDTRYAAAVALGDIADPDSIHAIQQLANDYPEVSTRRALLESIQDCEKVAVKR